MQPQPWWVGEPRVCLSSQNLPSRGRTQVVPVGDAAAGMWGSEPASGREKPRLYFL